MTPLNYCQTRLTDLRTQQRQLETDYLLLQRDATHFSKNRIFFENLANEEKKKYNDVQELIDKKISEIDKLSKDIFLLENLEEE